MDLFDLSDIPEMAQLAQDAGFTTKQAVILRLKRSLEQDARYLARRASRGTHTPTDDMMTEVALVKALVIEVLRGTIVLPEGERVVL